jgi:hypothetical protein
MPLDDINPLESDVIQNSTNLLRELEASHVRLNSALDELHKLHATTSSTSEGEDLCAASVQVGVGYTSSNDSSSDITASAGTISDRSSPGYESENSAESSATSKDDDREDGEDESVNEDAFDLTLDNLVGWCELNKAMPLDDINEGCLDCETEQDTRAIEHIVSGGADVNVGVDSIENDTASPDDANNQVEVLAEAQAVEVDGTGTGTVANEEPTATLAGANDTSDLDWKIRIPAGEQKQASCSALSSSGSSSGVASTRTKRLSHLWSSFFNGDKLWQLRKVR